MSSGASPFANGRKAPQARNRSGDTRAPSNNFTQQINLSSTSKHFATIFIVDAITQDIAKKRTHFAI